MLIDEKVDILQKLKGWRAHTGKFACPKLNYLLHKSVAKR
jgi:hypothetical protein